MTESRGAVEPPFSKRSVQLTIAAFALGAALWQLVTLTRLIWPGRAQRPAIAETHRWGELAGSGHTLIQIDLNRAGPRELSLLPGVGPVLARRIVESRRRFGPFLSLHDLARVHGIGSKTIERMDLIGYVEPTSGDAGQQLASGEDAAKSNAEASSIGLQAPLGFKAIEADR